MLSRDPSQRRAGIDESLHWLGIDPDVPPDEARFSSTRGWYCERSAPTLPWTRSATQFLVTDKGLYIRAMEHGPNIAPAWQATADRWPAMRLGLADIIHLETAADDPRVLGLGVRMPQPDGSDRRLTLKWVDLGRGKESSDFTATFFSLLDAIHNP